MPRKDSAKRTILSMTWAQPPTEEAAREWEYLEREAAVARKIDATRQALKREEKEYIEAQHCTHIGTRPKYAIFCNFLTHNICFHSNFLRIKWTVNEAVTYSDASHVWAPWSLCAERHQALPRERSKDPTHTMESPTVCPCRSRCTFPSDLPPKAPAFFCAAARRSLARLPQECHSLQPSHENSIPFYFSLSQELQATSSFL
jgi:hypothetical protein